MWWLNWRSSHLVTLIRVLSADYADFICSKLPWAENTHLLRKEKYHWTADLLFDQLGFGQTSKPVYSFNSTKQLNPNQTNRRSAVQWYFHLRSKWVFSGLSFKTLTGWQSSTTARRGAGFKLDRLLWRCIALPFFGFLKHFH